MTYDIDKLFEDKKPTYNIDNLMDEVEQPLNVKKHEVGAPDYARPYVSPSEYFRGVRETGEAIARGIPEIPGWVGDLEGFVGNIFADDGYETVLPTSSDIKKFVDETIGEQQLEVIAEEGADAGRFIGSFAPIGKGIKALTSPAADEVASIFDALRHSEFKFNDELAPLKLVDNKIVPDEQAISLINKTTPQKMASLVTKSNTETKRTMAKIAKDAIQMTKNPVSEVIRKPLAHTGKHITKRLDFLKGRRRALGGDLKNVLNVELKGVNIPLGDVKDDLIMGLSDMFNLKPRYSNGRLSFPDISKLDTKTQRSFARLNSLISRQSNTGDLSAVDAHRLKKILDDFVDATGNQRGEGKSVENVVMGLRKNLNDKLRGLSDNYANINDELSVIIEAEKPFVKYSKMGQYDLDPIIGQAFKGVDKTGITNEQRMQMIANLNEAVVNSGGKFNDDVFTMFKFATELDNFLRGTDSVARQIGGVNYTSSLLDMATSAGVNNVFGAAHDAKKLMGAGMKAKKANKLVRERKKAMNEMVYILNH